MKDNGLTQEASQEKVRSFLAIDFGNFYAQELSRLIEILKGKPLHAKWVDPQSCHLTLCFFGSIPIELIEAMKNSLEKPLRAFSPFSLELGGLGGFPNLKKPRVLWVGIKGEVEKLHQLKNRVDVLLGDFPIPKEDRPFKPHLTLARFQRVPQETAFPESMREFAVARACPIREIVLFKSELSREGARHTPLHRFLFVSESLDKSRKATDSNEPAS